MSTTQSNGMRKAACDLAARPPRERILIAARDLFYRHGLHPVGVDSIAEAALTNKMTLYRHFKSKDELIVAYIQQLADEGDEVWARIFSENPDDPQKRLDAWVDFVEDVFSNKLERGCALANAAVELDFEHPAKALIEFISGANAGNLKSCSKTPAIAILGSWQTKFSCCSRARGSIFNAENGDPPRESSRCYAIFWHPAHVAVARSRVQNPSAGTIAPRKLLLNFHSFGSFGPRPAIRPYPGRACTTDDLRTILI